VAWDAQIQTQDAKESEHRSADSRRWAEREEAARLAQAGAETRGASDGPAPTRAILLLFEVPCPKTSPLHTSTYTKEFFNKLDRFWDRLKACA